MLRFSYQAAASSEMSIDLESNSADFQLCDGFGSELDIINSA